MSEPRLSPEHRDFLSRQAVDVELAESLGVRSVLTAEDAADLPDPWPNYNRRPYIAFPWTSPTGRIEWQMRPDQPGKDEKGKVVKYRTRSKKMGFAPVLWQVRAEPDPAAVLIIEGTKQVLSGASYAPAGMSVYGIGGCRMWQSEGIPIPDLGVVEGRKVIVILDSDSATNPQVYDAGVKLTEALTQEGATEVLFTRMVGAGEKDGLDDVLAAREPHRRTSWLVRLIEGAKPKPADRRPKAGSAGAGNPPPNLPVLPSPDDPMAVVRALEPRFRVGENGPHRLRRWRGTWWTWQGAHWAEREDPSLDAELYSATEKALFWKETQRSAGYEKWAPTKSKIANLADALGGVVLLPRETNPPSWTEGTEGTEGTIVSVKNGLLKLEGRELAKHDPRFFNLVSVPFDYDPDAPEPGEWLKFLEVLWPDGGAGQVEALQEWFGYVISGRLDFQKMLAIIGPPRSGKGTIGKVLTELVGAANTAGPTLASLATNFGLQPLLGKTLAVISDARLGGRADLSQVVERLLNISGEDSVTVDRKHKESWTGKIPVRVMMMSNELPRFSDASGTIASRFIVLEHTKSFLGNEDRTLVSRLMAELPGILNWALAGLDRLLARGRFDEPETSKDLGEIMRQTASPYAAFVADQCVVGEQYETDADEMWAAWSFWCAENGRDRTGTKQWLGRDLRSVVPGLRTVRPRREDGSRPRIYLGVALRDGGPTESEPKTSTGPHKSGGGPHRSAQTPGSDTPSDLGRSAQVRIGPRIPYSSRKENTPLTESTSRRGTNRQRVFPEQSAMGKYADPRGPAPEKAAPPADIDGLGSGPSADQRGPYADHAGQGTGGTSFQCPAGNPYHMSSYGYCADCNRATMPATERN